MIGDGVIAESAISFKLTWKNPGNGGQPTWDQNSQEITFHETIVYPDLLYTNAQGIATYYTYTTIDKLLTLIKEINVMIDAKLGGTKIISERELPPGYDDIKQIEPSTNTTVQTVPKPQVPQTVPKNTSITPVNRNEEDIIEEPNGEPNEPGDMGAYTVVVYGKSLKFIDAQESAASIRIRHKVSANLTRKVGDEHLDNTKNIFLEVHSKAGRVVKLNVDDFISADKSNLLVQIFPTIELVLTPNEKAMSPKREETVDYEDDMRANQNNLRRAREGARRGKSIADTNAAMKKAKSNRT